MGGEVGVGGKRQEWGKVVGCGVGAVRGEIPAASAGMTDLGRGGMTEVVGRGLVLLTSRYPRQARV